MEIPEKIYKSLDFRNNKILSAKVETPVDNKHISNKEYVDISTKFDTPKASQFPISSSFPWLPNLFNKSFKDIFDDLFYPVKNPTYINPTFKNINVEISNLLNYSGNKAITYYNNNIELFISYEINTSDRISGIVPSIIVQYLDGSSVSFDGNSTSDVSGEFDVSFELLPNITGIILRKKFQQASVIKQDNYGNNFITPDFQLDYDLDFNVLKYLQNKFEITNPILRYELTNENYLDIFDNIGNYQFIKGDTLYLNNNSKYIFLIPSTIYEKTSDFECIISGTKHEISWEILKNNTSLLLDNAITIDNILYNFVVVDLGYYNISKLCELKFTKIRN